MMLDVTTPHDYLEPDWDEPGPWVHDWKRYVHEELQALWPSLADDLKLVIARNAQVDANNEDWD